MRVLEDELHSEENDDYHWQIFLLEQELNNTPEDDKEAREAIEAQIAALDFSEFVRKQYDNENKIDEY